MKWIFSLAIILSISLLGKEIDFDALANTKAQKTSVSFGFKDAVVTNEKKIMKLQMKQVKPIYDGLKAVAEYSRTHPNINNSSTTENAQELITKTSSSTSSTSKRNRSGVKEVYVGSHANGRALYVIKCHNGNSYYSINLHSNGFWYSYGSNMGDDYKNLSINAVANKKCR